MGNNWNSLPIFFYKTNLSAYPGRGEGDIEAFHLARGLHLEMTTCGILIPSGRKSNHTCTSPFITLPEAHQPPSVMSANCVSLSCQGSRWYYIPAPCPAKVLRQWPPEAITVGVESELSKQFPVLVASFPLLPEVHMTTRPPYSHGYMPGLVFYKQGSQNSYRILAIQCPHA